MLNHLKEAILDDWGKWDLGPAPKDISLIRRTSTWLNGDGKEVCYVFRKGDNFPLLIVKSVSSKASEPSILHEAQATILLNKWIQKKSNLTLPSPLCLTEIDGFPVYIEKAIPGVTLPEKVATCWLERGKKVIIQKIIFEMSNWLENFYKTMEVQKTVVTGSMVRKHFIGPLNQFKSFHVLTGDESKYLSWIESMARSLEGHRIAFPPVHGDLWGGSLLCGADDQLWIIDWEFFEPVGLPLQDFFCFAAHPGFQVHNHGGTGKGMLDEFMNLFHDSYFTDIIITYIYKHALEAGLEKSFIEMFFALTLIKLSIERDDVTKIDSKHSWRSLLGFFMENRKHCRVIK